MEALIPTIDEIVKYGLQPNLTVIDKEKSLERNLIKIYELYFCIEYSFDETDFMDFDKSNLPNIRQNVVRNFKDFGLYKTPIATRDLSHLEDFGIGDAIDDLTDIILDLLEIKWRVENNSLADGLWYFQLDFYDHTRPHILDLLNYLKGRPR